MLPAPSVHHQIGGEFSSCAAPKKLSAQECRMWLPSVGGQAPGAISREEGARAGSGDGTLLLQQVNGGASSELELR